MDIIKENIDLKPYTYFKIGGRARYFAEVTSAEQLRDAVRFAKSKHLPFFVFGAASNILVADQGYNGVAIRMMLRDVEREGTHLRIGAGVPNAIAVARSVKEGLAGFEWAIGIPGTIGGSVRGNAGCFSGEMADVVDSVTFLDTENGEIGHGDNAFCEFDYRESIFKKKPHLIVTEATVQLREGDPEVSQRLVRFYTSARTDSQDIGASSAGCVFKNVEWPKSEEARKRLIHVLPQLMDFVSQRHIPVGFLIDHLGLKGKTIGKTSVSKKHANYLINNGGSTAEEVVMLIGLLKEHIHRKYGLLLDEEIQYVGFH